MYSSEECSDFYNELNHITKDKLNNDGRVCKVTEPMCCITHQPLTKHFVKLDCGHVFNYEPLYKSLSASTKQQPTYFINQLPQISCPYCRNNTPWLLPFHKDLPFKRKAHVNVSYSMPVYSKARNCSKRGCKYLGAELGEIDKQQYNDTNIYCYTHMCTVLKRFDTNAVKIYKSEQKNRKGATQEK